MERLTNENGFCLDCDYIASCKGDCQSKKVYDKLKVYEDLGFEPEEIAHMAKFFKEHTSAEAIAQNMRVVAKLLEAERKEAYWIEHKRAEEDNWLLVSNYECSNCHEWKREHSDYCPNCGCKMMEVK